MHIVDIRMCMMLFSLLRLSIPAVLRNPFPVASYLVDTTNTDRYFNGYTLDGLGRHRAELVKSRRSVTKWQLAFVAIAIVAALTHSFTHDHFSLTLLAACTAGVGFVQARWAAPINMQRKRVEEEIKRRTDKFHDH